MSIVLGKKLGFGTMRLPLLDGGLPPKHRHPGLLRPAESARRHREKDQYVLPALVPEPRQSLRLPQVRPLRAKLPPAPAHPANPGGICGAVRGVRAHSQGAMIAGDIACAQGGRP